jgi:hypothetical protein
LHDYYPANTPAAAFDRSRDVGNEVPEFSFTMSTLLLKGLLMVAKALDANPPEND